MGFPRRDQVPLSLVPATPSSQPHSGACQQGFKVKLMCPERTWSDRQALTLSLICLFWGDTQQCLFILLYCAMILSFLSSIICIVNVEKNLVIRAREIAQW